jgi:O-antigen/teichoic acid export membrane protein
MSDSLRKFTLNVGWAFSSTAVAAVIGFGLNLVIGNSLGPEGLGLYGIVLTVYLVGTMAAAIGLPSALIKYSAEYQHEPEKLDSMVSAVLLLSTPLGLLTGLGIFALAGFTGRLLGMPALPALLRTLVIVFPFFMVNKTFLALLNGLRLMHIVSPAESLRYVLMLAFTLLLITKGYGVRGAVYAMILPEFLLLPLLVFFARKHYRPRLKDLWATTRTLTAFGLQTFLGNVIDNIGTRLNLFLIGYFLTASEVGIFTTVTMFYTGLIILPAAVQRITNPTISAHHGNNDLAAITRTVNQVMKYTMILLGIISIFLIVFIRPVIHIAYPNQPRFLDAVPPLTILMFSWTSYGAMSAIGSAPASMGQPRWNVVYAVVSLCVGLILNVLLVPRLGINGSAVATSITNVLAPSLFIYILKKALRIHVRLTTLIKLFLISVSLDLLALLGSYLGFHPLILALPVAVLYAGSLVLAGIVGHQDIALLQRILKSTQ